MKTMQMRTVWLSLLALSFPLLSHGQVPGLAVDQTNNYFGYYYNNVYSGWQSFTAGTNGHLGAVELWLYSTGGGSGNSGGTNWSATLSIYAGEGTAGARLVSQPITGDGTLQKRTFLLEKSIRQTNGSLYTIAFSGATTGLTIRTSGDNYTNGRCGFSAGYDHNFATWVLASDWSEEAYRDTSFTAADTVISNAAQLAQFAYLMNTSAYTNNGPVDLVADINLAGHFWTPISSMKYMDFRGNGHTIRSVIINNPDADGQGLFGVTQLTIGELTVADVDITGRNNVGGIAGSGRDTIFHCSASGRVAGWNTVGGIVGDAIGDVLFCTNNATVSGVSQVGGVAGSAFMLRFGSNHGAVSGSDSVGGVAGSCYLGLACANSGPVSGAAEWGMVGGIAGVCTFRLDTCRNSGPVTGAALVGGIAGVMDGSDTSMDQSGTLNACVNSGPVSGDSSVGGVVGLLFHASMLNSVNGGTVNATNYVGGIVGDNQGSALNCSNTGTVSGVTAVGGLAGRMLDSAHMLVNCANAGAVSGTSSAGGLAGTNDGAIVNGYWKQTGVAPFDLAAAGSGAGTLTDCRSFAAAPGTLASPVTVEGVTTSDLSAALNAGSEPSWMTDQTLRRWTPGTAGAYPLPMTAYWTDPGNYDTSWYSDAASQFTIGTAAELAGLSALVKSGNTFSNKTVTLSADISLSDYLWMPIGGVAMMGHGVGAPYPFAGNFEGNGKTVSGLYIDESDYSYFNPGLGFFGYLGQGGNVRNLMLDDVDITGMMVGGMASDVASGATVLNCSVAGRLGAYYGMAGIAYYSLGTILNCISIVQGENQFGLVGDNESVVSNCYWKYTGVDPYGAEMPTGYGDAPNCASFADAPGMLASNVTAGAVTTNNLSAALNAWVEANGGSGSGLYNWTAGSTERYPRLTPVIKVDGTPVPQTLTEGFAVGVTLTEATNTVAVYRAAHLGTTATSFGNLLCDADAMGFTFADLVAGQAILNFSPGLSIVGFDLATRTLTFTACNGIDPTATAAMNRLASSTAGVLKVVQAEAPGGPETAIAPTLQFFGDGTASADFPMPDPPLHSFFRLLLEHQP